MNFTRLLAVACLLLTSSLFSQQTLAFSMERFVEGTHYVTLKTPAKEKTVVEYFSYGCPHCFHLEPVLEKWVQEDLPEGVTFSRYPAIWNDQFRILAQLFYTLQSLGVEPETTPKVFEYLHKQGHKITKPVDAESFASQQGLNMDDFKSAWKSEEVKKNLIKASEEFVSHGVSGVPAIVVNGQYRTSVSMAGSNQELFDVVEFLLEK